MKQPDDRLRLHHMLDYAESAQRLTQSRNPDDLEHDEALRLALIRAIEVIGEAASKISLETRQNHPKIPWRGIIGMRNRLIHGYDAVDLSVVWRITHEEIPPLIEQLQAILDAT